MVQGVVFSDVLAWATAAVDQVALTDQVTGDRPEADPDARRDRALATVLLEAVVAQARYRGLGPSAAARSTIAAMLGVPGDRPAVDVPPFVAEAEPAVLGTIHEAIHGLALTDDGLAAPDGSRKAAGAYYTPPQAVAILLDHTLGPVLAARNAAADVAEVRLCDPACGGGNFLHAAAGRIADRLTELGTPTAEAREQAARCLLGVDVDPVAVVLARLGLWLFVADRTLPPTAFTAQVVLGDALGGQRPGAELALHEGAFEPAADDHRPTATAWRNAWRTRLSEHPDTVLRAVAADARLALDALDLVWQAPKRPDEPNPLDVVVALADGAPEPREAGRLVQRLARRHRPLHWPIEVPASVRGFDVVVGNPPYVKSRAHGRSDPGLRRRLTRTRPECRGGQWNLFVPFVALAADLLRPGGRAALLVPNAVLAADFAAPLQRYVVDRVVDVLDFTRADLFDQAAVHVASLVTTCEPREGPVRFVVHDEDLDAVHESKVDADLLDRLPPGYWCLPLLLHDLDFTESDLLSLLEAPKAIGDVATSRDGATTQEAYALKPLVRELEDGEPLDEVFRFANTGTIDPDTFLWGTRRATYLGEKYLRPVVGRQALADDFPKRAVEAGTPKVLLAGLSARLEAVADEDGTWLCGKSAVQVLVEDGDSARQLADWLNRPELTALYRALFGLAGFGGSGMNVAPALVARLPAPPVPSGGVGA